MAGNEELLIVGLVALILFLVFVVGRVIYLSSIGYSWDAGAEDGKVISLYTVFGGSDIRKFQD